MRNRTETSTHIAYLTPTYPSISHSFIRREILALEQMGYKIERVAIRPGEGLIDEEDIAEQNRTFQLLSQSKLHLISAILEGVWLAKFQVLGAAATMLKLSRNSERGLLRHVFYLIEALAILTYLHENNVDHIHVHFGTNMAGIALLISELSDIGFSITVHGPTEFDAPIGLSLGRKIEASRFIAAISHFCVAQLKRWVSYSEWDKIHIVRCTVAERWLEHACPINPDADSIVTIGRMNEQKGQLLLINAFGQALDAGYQGRLVMVGDGEMRDVVEQRVAALGIAQHVVFAGWCDQAAIQKLLQEARALVLPSFAEGLPVVIMEAFALSRPVITTSIAGIPELVEHGNNGWLVAAGDQSSLTDVLLELHNTPVERLNEMGKHGQTRVEANHMVSQVEHLADLFDQYAGPASTS